MISYFYALAKNEKKGIFAALLSPVLLIFSFLYVFISEAIKICYRWGILKSEKLNCKVVSIGNITLGGTGKTPFVAMLAKRFSHDGRKVVILIRGYKRRGQGIGDRGQGIETMGDEGYLLSKELGIPVLVGSDRVNSGKEAVRKHNSDVVILDDGFQHWRLRRDLDIVLVNALNPFGNNRVIPRGILREPLSALKRADVLALTKTGLAGDPTALKNKLAAINPRALIIETRHNPLYFYALGGRRFELSEIKNKEACVFSGVADPASFYEIITRLGAVIGPKFEFRDHHHYSQGDLDKIFSACKNSAIGTVITTEKDSVKIESLKLSPDINLLVLKIELEITKNEQEFYLRLSSL